MDIINTILNRHSTRQFIAHEPIDSKDIEIILRCACQAPSAMNQQDWAFMVINEEGLLTQLQNTLPYAGFLKDAGCAIALLGNPEEAFEEYWRVDSLLAGQNILLAAEGLGLGSCWCGIYPNPDKMKMCADILAIPEPYQVMALIAIGHPAPAALHAAIQPRYNSKKIHFNRW